MAVMLQQPLALSCSLQSQQQLGPATRAAMSRWKFTTGATGRGDRVSTVDDTAPPHCSRAALMCPRRDAVEMRAQHPAEVEERSTEDLSTSYGRRNLVLMLIIPFLVSLHQNVRAIDRSEESVVQDSVRSILSKTKAAGVLRMVFHDAGTFDLDDNSGGMNGSIVYELDRPENAGLERSLKVLGKAKMAIENIQQVSWADLIAVAGAEAVALCGGPAIPVQLGRLDVSAPDPPGRLPQETLDAPALKSCFLKKGFSTRELVALSGAHTIGNKGFGNPNVFDNSYFRILLDKPWASSDGITSMIGLPSDRALAEDEECLRWIKLYAEDHAKFFSDFKKAYIKLVNSGASWRNL